MSNQLKFTLLIIFIIAVCLYTLWFYSGWHGAPVEDPSIDQTKASTKLDQSKVEIAFRLNKTV